MINLEDLQQVLSAQLGNAYSEDWFSPDRRLMGEVPEFDSMSVVGILTAIEDTFGIEIPDDEISADMFETVGALLASINQFGSGS